LNPSPIEKQPKSFRNLSAIDIFGSLSFRLVAGIAGITYTFPYSDFIKRL
jgi:hypothetical protein